MGLIVCKNCGKEISDRAKECPSCGSKVIIEEEKSITQDHETITCPECGFVISADMDICPNCGFPLSEERDNKQEDKSNSKKGVEIKEKIQSIKNKYENNKKRILIAASVIVALLMIAMVLGNKVSPTEQYAIGMVENLQKKMKDPDSFVLRDDVLVIQANDRDTSDSSDDSGTYVFIIYSANNSYGAKVIDTAMYKDYRYLGNLDDDADDLYPSNEELDDKLDFLTAKIYVSAYNLAGKTAMENWISAEMASKKKVAKKLHINYLK